MKTKKALYEYTKGLLEGLLQKGPMIVPPAETQFLLELFTRHPNHEAKVGPGVRCLRISKNTKGGAHLEIEKLDGNIEAISWVTCCRGAPRSEWYYKNLEYRKQILDDILAFKNCSAEEVCKMCGSCENIEVDHCGEFEFKDIVKMYELEVEFQPFSEFHQKFAKYQLLCRKCHQKKSCS